MNFEMFDRSKHLSDRTPKITVQKSGVISFNVAASDKFKNASAIQLFFDKDKQVIGFKPAVEGDNTAFPFRIARREGRITQASVSAKQFLNYFHIDFSETKMYEPYNESGYTCIDVKSGRLTGRRSS